MTILTTVPRNRVISLLIDNDISKHLVGSLDISSVPSPVWDQVPYSLRLKIQRAQDNDYAMSPEETRLMQSGIIAVPDLAQILAQNAISTPSGVLGTVSHDNPSTITNEVDLLKSSNKKHAYDEAHWAELYKKTGDTAYKDKAVMALRPLIMKKVHDVNVSKSISSGSLISYSYGLAGDAVDSWDPKKAKLTTHVTNQLKKLTRKVNQYGPMLHVPEHRIGSWSDLDSAFSEYEHEYGTSSYDPKILASATGLPMADVTKAITERRKVFNDSTVTTSNVPWKTKFIGLDLTYLEREFEYDPLKKKIYKVIQKLIKESPAGDYSNIQTSEVLRNLPKTYKGQKLTYKLINREKKYIDQKIKDAYSFG